MNKNFCKLQNIKVTLIALIIVLAVIFIIVGERPRHKAPLPDESISAPVTKAKPYAKTKPVSEIAPAKQLSKPTETTTKAAPTKAPADQATGSKKINVDAKKIIQDKYKDTDNKDIYARALENHKTNIAQVSSAKKDDTDSAETEAGVSTDIARLSSGAEQETAATPQKSGGQPTVSGKNFLDLKEPVDTEAKADTELNKISALEETNPTRYTTVSTSDQSMIYMIDTYTAEVKVLYKKTDIWKDLGKPAEIKSYTSSTYALEAVTKESAVIFNSTTAHTWKVSINGDDIAWKAIHPFPEPDNGLDDSK